jgi:hypothetical protein
LKFLVLQPSFVLISSKQIVFHWSPWKTIFHGLITARFLGYKGFNDLSSLSILTINE